MNGGKEVETPLTFCMPRRLFELPLVERSFHLVDDKFNWESFERSCSVDIFEPARVHCTLFSVAEPSSTFSFLRFICTTPTEFACAARTGVFERWVHGHIDHHRLVSMCDQPGRSSEMFLIRPIISRFLRPLVDIPSLCPSPRHRLQLLQPLLRAVRSFVPPVAASPQNLYVLGSRRAAWMQASVLHNSWISRHLTGLPRQRTQTTALSSRGEFKSACRGLVEVLDLLLDRRRLWVPDRGQLIADSGKLRALDQLLTRLKAEGHRVLCYSQMTKMIDILEDFMAFRKHRYIRLDGSSKLSERRDMVEDFQTNPNIFVFLLSTRAGGLGINLTSADTVIFYDSDWNPTNDAQAMDRAHRIGQTEQVTVYRLLTKDTIEERILHRAQEKNKIQSLVIAGGKFDRSTLKPKEVVSLLGLST